MPRKVDAAARRADILAALARTANVRLSLKEVGVSHCWAYRERGRDGDFRARWDTAVRTGKRALAAAKAAVARDPGAARPAEGMVMVGSSGKGTLRLERAKPCSFTPAKRAAFLATLRATCNVRAAARAARVSAHGAYAAYHADAGLRTGWDAALVEGRVHLEMALLASARSLVEPVAEGEPVAAPAAITGMDAALALQLLRLHAPTRADGRARGRWVKPADLEGVRREILAKVAALRAARDGEVGA